MANGWDDSALTWDEDPYVVAYAAAAYESLVSMLAGRSGAAAPGGRRLGGGRVLDFGCGTGLLTERLVEQCHHVDAVDTSAAMLEVLQAKIDRNGWTNVSVAREVALLDSASTDNGYDFIVCSSVCAFLDNYPATVGVLVEMMRPGGVFVQWDWERSDDVDAGGGGLTRSEILAALTGAGLAEAAVSVGFTTAAGDVTMSPLMGVGTMAAEDQSLD